MSLTELSLHSESRSTNLGGRVTIHLSEESCFEEQGNAPILKWKLGKEIQKMGYLEGDVISVLRDLVNDGILYEPNMDSYRMTNG
jgi:hypothetical protein